MITNLSATLQRKFNKTPDVNYIRELVMRHGPLPGEYAELDAWFETANQAILDAGAGGDSVRQFLMSAFEQAMSLDTVQGHVWHRPNGYHGDYEVIEHIYCRRIASEPMLRRWDHYFHQHAAAKAVRNRIGYFASIMENAVTTRQGPLNVLLLGSGPAREVCEFLDANPDANAHFTGLDIDPNAVAHATALNHPHLGKVSFLHTNVLRFHPLETYDVVWAAGLFDYFSDAIFRRMVRRYSSALRPGGEMVVGNFGLWNPSRAYMEFGGWRLLHRDSEQLLGLSVQAAPSWSAEVRTEAEGVNHFLHLKRA